MSLRYCLPYGPILGYSRNPFVVGCVDPLEMGLPNFRVRPLGPAQIGNGAQPSHPAGGSLVAVGVNTL